MIDAAKATTKAWAKAFGERHGAVHETPLMHTLRELERGSTDPFRRAMACLPFDLFTVTVVHYTSDQIAQQKVREVSYIAGEQVTRREYWNRLDRVHHFVAGIESVMDMARSQPEQFLEQLAASV